jgi:hypothetical protein
VHSPPAGKRFHLVMEEAQLAGHLVGALDLRTSSASPWPQGSATSKGTQQRLNSAAAHLVGIGALEDALVGVQVLEL